MCHRFILCGEFVAGRDEQERVGSYEGWLQRRRIREIANKDIDAAAEPLDCLVPVAHENPRPLAANDQALNNERAHVPGCAGNEVCHGALLRKFYKLCTTTHKYT
jgi:hypothetical protein